MNREILKRLYEEAYVKCWNDEDSSAWKFEEEFAKAIIGECCKVIDNIEEAGEDSVYLKNHFGI